MDRVSNEEVRRRAGIERELTSIADQRWCGHVEINQSINQSILFK